MNEREKQIRKEARRRRAAIEIELARRDRNRFVEQVIRDKQGRRVKQGAIHRELQELFSQPGNSGAEIPRDHGKSTNVAVAGSSFEIGKNRNIRIKIVCASSDLAVARVRSVKEIIEKEEQYRKIFPGVKPGRQWTDSKLMVERDFVSPDGTLEGYGVTSSQTGGRADLIVFDDVVDVESVRSAAARVTVKERVENVWMNLLEPDGRAWWIATPWHRKDYTAELRDRGTWRWIRRPVGANFEPVWPEAWGPAALRERYDEIGPVAYARGFRLQPLADEDMPIRPEMVGFWTTENEIPEAGVKCMGVDPAISKRDDADRSAIVEGVYAAPRFYVTSLTAGRWNFPELLKLIRRRAKAFDPVEISVESVAYQKAISQQLLDEAQSFPWPIVEAIPGAKDDTKDKHTRVAWLAGMLERGQILLRGNPRTGQVADDQKLLFDELTGFPAEDHDDTVDALFWSSRRAMNASRVFFEVW